MLPKRISAKLFIDDPKSFDITSIIPVFHHWIQEQAVDDILIDVIDYKHVPDGPGILLVGHYGVYSLDLTATRPGFRYRQKRGWTTESLQERLAQVIQKAIFGAHLLASAPEFEGRIDSGQIELAFIDHLNTPNGEETAAALKPQLSQTAQAVFGIDNFELVVQPGDRRMPLTATIKAKDAPDLQALLNKLTPAAV